MSDPWKVAEDPWKTEASGTQPEVPSEEPSAITSTDIEPKPSLPPEALDPSHPFHIGPPSTGLPQEALNPPHSSPARAIISNLSEAIPGASQISAFANLAPYGGPWTVSGLIGAYQKSRQVMANEAELGRKEYPWLAAGGSVAGTLPTMLAAGATGLSKATAPMFASIAQNASSDRGGQG